MNKLATQVDVSFADNMKRLGDQIIRWNKIRKDYDGVLARLADLDADFDVSGGYNLYIRVAGDANLLTKIVRAIRTSGWKLDKYSKPPEANTSTWYADFEKEGCESDLCISFTSTVCKRIQIGTEMREVPIFKTVCGDVSASEGTSIEEVA